MIDSKLNFNRDIILGLEEKEIFEKVEILKRIKELNDLIFGDQDFSNNNIIELTEKLISIVGFSSVFKTQNIVVNNTIYFVGVDPKSTIAEKVARVVYLHLRKKKFNEFKDGNLLIRYNFASSISQKENVLDSEIALIKMRIKRYANAYESGKKESEETPEVINYFRGYMTEKGAGMPDFKGDFRYEKILQIAEGAADYLLEQDLLELKEDLIQQIEENKKLNEVGSETELNIKQKIAWMYELGVLDKVVEKCTFGGAINATKAGNIIKVFTEIDAGTIRKYIEAIYKPNKGNQKDNPLINSDGITDLKKKLKID